MFIYQLTFVLLISAPLIYTQVSNTAEPVSELCLGCICEAVSNCNRSLACEGDVCGIFRITWPYWADAGKPVLDLDDPNSNGAYQRCVNDPVCAARTVTGYMNRFAQDCTGDGKVDCWDYAAIHKLGGYGCKGPLNEQYKAKFISCQQQAQALAGGVGQIDARSGLPAN